MYLDTDIILALLKDDDWLQSAVQREKLEEPKTSVLTLTEIQLLKPGEKPGKILRNAVEEIRELEIEILELDTGVAVKASELYLEIDKLNTFDLYHLAHADIQGETVVSTETLYPEIEEIDSIDPREL